MKRTHHETLARASKVAGPVLPAAGLVCHADVAALMPGPGGNGSWALGWRRVDRELPDAEVTVMIFCPRGIEPVWLGFLDFCESDGRSVWRDVNAERLEGDDAPSHWAPMPDPPIDGEVGR